MNYIQEHSPFLYTHLPSNFFSNQLVFHHYSQLHYKYLSPISPPIPPSPSTYPPLHLMALQLCRSLPCILLLSPQQLKLLFFCRIKLLISVVLSIEETNIQRKLNE